MKELVFFDLPKISNNQFYAGIHWTRRRKIKDAFVFKVYEQLPKRFKQIGKPCNTEYYLEFKSRALDASNCVGMIKILEDVLFADDSPKIVKSVLISSKKSKLEKVTVRIIPI